MCKDPALTYLQSYGFNVLRLPTTRLRPMDVVGRDETGPRWLGSISSLCDDAAPLPRTETGRTGSLQGKTTAAFNIDAALRILDGLLGSLGFRSATARAAYHRAKYLQFTFDDPVIKLIEPGKIGSWLHEATPSQGNPFATRFLRDPDPRVSAVIVSSTLMSRELTVIALDKDHRAIDADVRSLDQSFGNSMKVESVATHTGRVRYKGDELLAFGFNCYQIEYENERWAIPRCRPKDIPYMGEGEEPENVMLGEDQVEVSYSDEAEGQC